MSSYTKAATLAITSDTTVNELVAAPGARAFINVHLITFSNTSVTDTFVDVLDGATIVMRKQAVPAGLGNNPSSSKPLRLAENTALSVQSNTSVADLNVTVWYDIEPSGNG
jgi:hypothetical protein